jgi:NAD(P)-dependent dehydrogenase (short-subunit alcohol dehydrogenase family)
VIFDLSGRVALVTGAGQNVGAGIARMLAGQGAAVAVNDVAADRAQATVESIEAAGGRAVAAPFDVTDVDAVLTGVELAAKALGPIDILVNNAGNGGAAGMQLASFRELSPADWEAPIRVNLYGVLNCTKAVRTGVTCNTLALGLMAVQDRTATEQLARRIPVGRAGTPEDIGAACVWLASDEASWVTAQTIEINGGSITT